MGLKGLLLSVIAVCAICAKPALADVDPRSEYDKKIKAAQVVGPLGSGVAGDSSSLYTGATSFNITDASVPGTGPAMSIGRSYAVELDHMDAFAPYPVQATTRLRSFGNWDIDVPTLSGVYAAQGWEIDSTTPKQRCSVLSQLRGDGSPARGLPRASPIATPMFWATQFWSGVQLNVPGAGQQSLLVADAAGVPKPTTGGTYHWTTKNDWWLSCLPQTVNGVAAQNTDGEAFLAISPDGTKYWFNHMSWRWVSQLKQTNCVTEGFPEYSPPGDCYDTKMLRREYLLLPTRVEDRFGNSVTYTWSSHDFARLTSMQASDGRQLTLTYTTAGYVATISDGTRTWHYEYAGSSLTGVVLPDGSRWGYSFAGLDQMYSSVMACFDMGEPINCFAPWVIGSGAGSVVTPSGATVSFGFGTHFKPTVNAIWTDSGAYPMGITSKSITGPGLTPATWTFSYWPTRAEMISLCNASQCPQQVYIDALAPDGALTRTAFGIVPMTNQGLMLSEQTGSVVNGSPVFTDSSVIGYAPVQGNGYIAKRGTNPMMLDPGIGDEVEAFYSERKLPVNLKQRTLQGVAFAWTANSFDAYAAPTTVVRASTGNSAGDSMRTEENVYEHDTAKWVIGQLATVTCVGSTECTPGKVMSRTTYHAASRLPWKKYQFEALQAEFGYDAAGNLTSVKDGLGNTTTLGDWYRSVPRLITFPGTPTTQVTATVNPVGWISATIDPLNSKTCYQYDLAGRINLVTQTTEAANVAVCDGTTWALTNLGFASINAVEYGIPAGHWRHTAQTGNGKVTTYYNALWQPLLVLTEDTANTLTRSFVVTRYDAMGRQTFQSYPVATLTSVNDTLKGVRRSYDGLGRVVQVQQDSENVGGQTMLNTSTEYLAGFQTRVTNPRGLQTTTKYQVFDGASTDAPWSISLPEGVWTTITRDIFGKPKSVSRSGTYAGNALGLTRSYVYDAYERLCQTINPESGTTIVNYDAAGNVLWSAEGQTATGLTATSCAADRTATATAAMTSRVYDPLNRVTQVSTPGNAANVTTLYEADGKVKQLTTNQPGTDTVKNFYYYNRRRLLTQEKVQVNANGAWQFDYAYNNNGHLSSQTYPGALVVGYAPDALGRPTQAGTFATGVTYYPNGAISGFTYGNGIVHTMTQNDRQLPTRSLDAFGATKFLDDTYTYDGNGNVLSLADALPANGDNRTWTAAAGTAGYDGLDRLKSVTSAHQWGTASYSYDPLDNLRTASLGALSYTYAYDAANRLASLNNGQTTYAFTHDGLGRMTSSALKNQSYQFDTAHRMTAVTGKESYLYDGNGRRARTLNSTTGSIEYFGYGADGRLLQDWSNRRNVRNGYVYLGNTLVGLHEVNITTFAVAPRYKHTDALGSPVVTTDASRAVTGRQAYSPYGIPVNPVDGVGYTGHFIDVGTGLTYMQQRYYDPQIGRFLSVDPVAARETGDNFNRYNYTNNNPNRFIDPDGREYVESADELRKKYDRKIEGQGHHWVPFGSTNKMDLSSEARSVFGQSKSGEPLPNSEHLVGHPKYNDAVRAELVGYAKSNGIDLTQMTKAQARDFVSHIRASHHSDIKPMVSRVTAWTERVRALNPAFRGVFKTLVGWGVLNEVQSNFSDQQAACRNDSVCNAERMQ